MRAWVPIVAVMALNLHATPACGGPNESMTPDADTIAALEARASQAQPREQCYLYAQVVQQMTELSIRQYAGGDAEKATSLLKQVQRIAQKIHLSLTDNDKRLKNAEILLGHTAFRLKEMLHASSLEDRPLVEQTLAQVNEARDEAMMEVFQK